MRTRGVLGWLCSPATRQAGFTLIELSVAGLILLVVGILALPSVRDRLAESRVQSVSVDLQRAVARISSSRLPSGQGAPFAAVSTDELAGALHGTVFQVVAGVISHPLGSGQGSATVTAGVGNITGVSGESMWVAMNNLARTSCIGLVMSLAPLVARVDIRPSAKDPLEAARPYQGTLDASAVQRNCRDGALVQVWFV